MKQSILPILMLAGVIAVTALPSAASTVLIYSNFTEGANDSTNPYNSPSASAYAVEWTQQYYFVTGGLKSFGIAEAMQFTVGGGQDLYLQSVAMAMYKFPSNTPWDAHNNIGTNHDNLTIELVGSLAGGSLPDASNVLEVLSVNPLIAEDETTFLDLNSASHPLLQQGKTYWVVAKPTDYSLVGSGDDSYYGWLHNDEGAKWNYTVSQYASGSTGGSWGNYFSQPRQYDAPALNVVGSTSLDSSSPTPEPGSALLFLAGLTVLGVWTRRRRA